jgi:hypothetical protein
VVPNSLSTDDLVGQNLQDIGNVDLFSQGEGLTLAMLVKQRGSGC